MEIKQHPFSANNYILTAYDDYDKEVLNRLVERFPECYTYTAASRYIVVTKYNLPGGALALNEDLAEAQAYLNNQKPKILTQNAPLSKMTNGRSAGKE